MPRPLTLYDKIWDAHVIEDLGEGMCLIGTDRQLIYEGTSLPALKALAAAGRKARIPSRTVAIPDHAVPTDAKTRAERTFKSVEELRAGAAANGFDFFGMEDPRHGIVHVVGPEQGFTLPGLVIACADSHTSTHGAFGALAFGIGTSELAHILATQTLVQRRTTPLRLELTGRLGPGASAKDMALAALSAFRVTVGVGHAIEFCGDAVERLSMEGRMTLCNMAVEMGARSGMIAPDDTTFAWLKGRPMSPQGSDWLEAVAYWNTLRSDPGAVYAGTLRLDLADLAPYATWGTSPDQAVPINGRVPDPKDAASPAEARTWARAQTYMDLTPGIALGDVQIQRAFIGSCTNSRLEDLRSAAKVLEGRRIADHVSGLVVPGSALVKAQAEAEGLHHVFLAAGLEWREAGCSMCFGDRFDSLKAGERCASSTNRNFENRQGPGGRTHLMSPASVAACAIAGRLADVREYV